MCYNWLDIKYRFCPLNVLLRLHNYSVYIKVIDGGTTPDIGASYNLSCAVSGTDALTRYQWRKDGVVSPSKTGPTLFFSSLMLSDAGQYSCGNGTLFSNPWTLTLKGNSECPDYN